MQHPDYPTIELILIVAVAVAMLFQSAILMALFVAMRKAIRSSSEQIESLRSSVTPLIENSHSLITRIGPKIEKTADNLAVVTHTLRVQTGDVQTAATEIIARVRTQANRLDALITDLLDGVDRAGGYLSDAVAKPMRQLSAILASIRAAIETLRSDVPSPHSEPVSTPGDNDLFV
jgi:ABC-type transporter Mla subunit MlaD